MRMRASLTRRSSIFHHPLALGSMKIILVSIDEALANAWEQFCGNLEMVTVHHGSIFQVACDAVVSPANSFGFMDGGIDMQYSQRFGWHVQDRLQSLIRERHHGELLVGAADMVETDFPQIPYLIAAPTMRIPMILRDSVNAYLAARAVLLLVKYGVMQSGNRKGTPIKDLVSAVAFPGLGTGVGRLGPNRCAHQVRVAIEEVLLEERSFPRTWAEAATKHQQLYTNRIRNLQHE